MQQTVTKIKTIQPTRDRLYTFADVMTYLHGINISREDKKSVGRQLIFEAENENKAKVLNRLEHLSTLAYDWDGYGALPISNAVIDNLKKTVDSSRDEDWAVWMISPTPNGTLTLQSKRHTASISIGDEEFSYYSCINNTEMWADNVKFAISSFLKIMRQIG